MLQSILRAHSKMVDGEIEYSIGEVMDANINRSPTAYLQNPVEERNRSASASYISVDPGPHVC